MSDKKASKEWAPYSKEIKLDESDWSVVEALYQEYRNRQGVISKGEFLRNLILTGASTQLVRLRQLSPASIARIGKTSAQYSRKD